MRSWILLSLEGFRVIGKRTYSFFVWTFVLMIGMICALSAGLASVNGSGDNSSVSLTSLGVAAGVLWLWLSVLTAAVYSAILRPDANRFAYLRLGPAAAWTAAAFLPGFLAWIAFGLVRSKAGPGAIPLTLGAAALWSTVCLIGPALFDRGPSGFSAARRLARKDPFGLVVMCGATWLVVAIAVTLDQAAWRLFATSVLKAMAQGGSIGDVDPRQFGSSVGGGMLPAMMAYTAILVLAVAPAAAAYKKLRDEDAAASELAA